MKRLGLAVFAAALALGTLRTPVHAAVAGTIVGTGTANPGLLSSSRIDFNATFLGASTGGAGGPGASNCAMFVDEVNFAGVLAVNCAGPVNLSCDLNWSRTGLVAIANGNCRANGGPYRLVLTQWVLTPTNLQMTTFSATASVVPAAA